MTVIAPGNEGGANGKRHEGLAGSRILEGNEERRKVGHTRPPLMPQPGVPRLVKQCQALPV